MTLKVNGRRDRGRPKKTWEQVIASDLLELGVTQSLAQDRLNWRKTILMNSLNTCQHGIINDFKLMMMMMMMTLN